MYRTKEFFSDMMYILTKKEKYMPRYKVHYSADVWEYVIVEADTPKQAQELFETHDDKYFEAREDEPEQMGMENIKVDMVEEA
jgi:hypothetical protein